jgi:tetratricopeptide (TPR) repeat protein
MIPPNRGSLQGVLHRVSSIVFLLALAIALPGCSKLKELVSASEATPGPGPGRGSKPPDPSLTEAAWIVSSVCDEIVRTAMFAARAEPSAFTADLVAVTPKSKDGSGYHYAVDFHLPKQEVIHTVIDVPGSIWDPQAYLPFTRDVLARMAIEGEKPSGAIGGQPLVTLTNLRAEVIQKENHRISEWLTAHPLDPAAHEQAALVVGALGMRENCGSFFDTHDFCNHAAAHLALARALRADQSIGDAGAVAELLVGLLVDTKQDCERRIDALTARIGAAPELKPWTVAARLRNRRDYRILPNPENATLLERIELFRATDESAGSAAACKALEGSLREPLADWTRILLEMSFSVEEGHQFTENALRLEFAEAARIFPEASALKPSAETLAKLYNREPGSLVIKGADGAMKVSIIDDGMWAMFLQRHLCHTIESIHYFLRDKWGVKDEAVKFKISMSALFQPLTLFPLVSVDANDPDWVRNETVAANKLIETHPEWIPEDLWGRFVRGQPSSGLMHPDRWYSPGLPPGTAYRFRTRAEIIKEIRNSSLADAQRYFDLAPWQYNVAHNLYLARAAGRPNAALFKEVLGRFLDYYSPAMEGYAELVKDNPTEYIATMRRLADQNPGHFLQLGSYLAARHMDKEAADAYENALKLQVDSVWVSNNCQWIVNYYVDHGNVDRAMEIAKFAAEVYSSGGLETMGNLMERLNKLPEAEDYFQKIAERYNNNGALSAFYVRQYQKNPSSPFAEKYRQLERAAFPSGLRNVSVGDFHEMPKSGVFIQNSNDLLQHAGMKPSDVIVALDGKRVDTFEQYNFVRAMTTSDEMDFIVWSNGNYRALHARVPSRRFGLKFVTYRP